MKTCTKCGESKPLEAYGTDKSRRKDGLTIQCRTCRSAKSLAWYKENQDHCRAVRKAWDKGNKERVSAKNAAYYSRNKNSILARNALWYAENKERKAAYLLLNKERKAATNAAWCEANKDRIAATNAAWLKANPGAAAERKHRYRALKAANGINQVTAAEIAAIAAMPCMACGIAGPSEVDHIVPIARGGAHTIGNLMPLCRSCNASKRDMLYIEWKYSARPQALKAFAA